MSGLSGLDRNRLKANSLVQPRAREVFSDKRALVTEGSLCILSPSLFYGRM